MEWVEEERESVYKVHECLLVGGGVRMFQASYTAESDVVEKKGEAGYEAKRS